MVQQAQGSANDLTLSKRYVIQQEIGRGGMGAVYQALDRLTGDSIALKRVTLPASAMRFASMPENAEPHELALALAHEFRLMASLRHPHINSVLDYGFDSQRQPYYTMELLTNAKSIFRATWGQPDRIKIAAVVQLLQALAYLHRRGILHRDLKPANALVSNGIVRVLDFGLSVAQEQVPEKPAMVAGTVGYIPPEVLHGGPPNPQTDLFAVGVITYEILTGQSLYSANDTQVIIRETISGKHDLNRIANPDLARVVKMLLEKDPAYRFRDAESAIAAFCEALNLAQPKETSAIRESFLQAARFVGRENELQELVNWLGKALHGQGSIHLIAGESGVGKTRLIDELRAQALTQGFILLRGQNTDQGNVPYQVWRTPLRFMALTTPLSDDEAAILAGIVPDIATLLNRSIPTAPEVSPLAYKSRLLNLVEEMFRRQRAPILIVLEDLQWANNESFALLRRLSQIAPTLKTLVIATYRDDERPDLAKELPGVPELKLTRLSEDGITALSVAILGEAGKQPALLKFLKQETEGNVFFLVEIMRSLAEQVGQLRGVGTMTLPEHVVTGGVAQVLLNRLRRVPEGDRALLQVAAVAGRYLDRKLMLAFAPSADELDLWLADCVNVAVLDVQDNLYRFAHDKLREAVLSTISADTRRSLHHRIAEAIETVYMLQINEYNAELVHHATAAGDLAKRAHYAGLAGKQALSSGAYQSAVTFLTIARDTPIDDPHEKNEKKEAAIRQQLGEAYAGLNQMNQAAHELDAALQLNRAAGYRWGIAAVLNELGNLSLARDDDRAALGYFKQALADAMAIRAQAIALPALIGAACVYAKTNSQRALELLSFALSNPSVDARARERAEAQITALKSVIPPDQFEQKQRQSESLRLVEIAKLVTDESY